MAAPLELRLRITGDSAGLSASLRDAEGHIVHLGQSGQAAGRSVNTGMSTAQQGAVNLSRQLTQLRSIIGGLVGVSVGLGMARELVRDAAAVQDLQTRLHGVTDAANDYAAVQVYLSKVAKDQHKDINDLTGSYASLRELQNSGLLTNTKTKAILEGMGNVASKAGASNDQLKLSFYGLSQLLASAIPHMEDLNQVTEPLPGLLQKLDDAVGEGAGGMRRLVLEGKMTGEMFSDYLVVALKKYDGAAAATGKNINANFTDLKNSYTSLVTVLESPISSVLVPLLKELSNGVNLLSRNMSDTLDDQIAHAEARIKTYASLPIAVKAIGFVGSMGQYDIADEQRKLAALKDLKRKNEEKRDEGGISAVKDISKLALYQSAEQKYQLPAKLVQAIASIESSGQQSKVSSAGALGIMQVVPAAHPEFNADRLKTDAAYNIDAGAHYLAQLNKIFNGDLPKVIAAYNAGQGAVQKAGGVPSNPETQTYVPKVLAAMDKLLNNDKDDLTLVKQFKTSQTLIKNQREAVGTLNNSRIDTQLKTTTDQAENALSALKNLKEQGKIGITEYYQALTDQQTVVINANISAIKAKLIEAERLGAQAQATAKPEELPKLAADNAAKKAELNAELQGLQLKLSQIKPANLIDQDQEQQQLDAIVNQVRGKLAELRGETGRDPIAIKLRLELENADLIKKLKQGGQAGLADQYLNSLSGTEQAGIIQADIGKVQQRTQAQETRINLLQQSGSITQFNAQNQLKQLYHSMFKFLSLEELQKNG